MPQAGRCSECSTVVWLDPDGNCQNGHPASCISETYEAEPQQLPVEATADPAQKPRRRRLLVALIAIGVAAVLGTCLLVAFVARPLMSASTEMANEWRSRLAEDYPGWNQVGFNVRSWRSSDGSESEARSSFGLVPPGRDFPVGIVYVSTNGSDPVLKDHVLTPGGKHHDRAESLLDYLDDKYIDKKKTLVAVTSDEFGTVTVTWMREKRIGPFSSRNGSYDQLDYNEETGKWRVLYSPTP